MPLSKFGRKIYETSWLETVSVYSPRRYYHVQDKHTTETDRDRTENNYIKTTHVIPSHKIVINGSGMNHITRANIMLHSS